MNKSPYDIIISPLITEKGAFLREKSNYYVFKVRKDANKKEIKWAIENLYKVKVEKVRTQIVKPKPKRLRHRLYGRTSSWKKAYVKLKEGETIPLYEGV
ncbi:MAG: 50S ribosomal protein L23 [candidate division WOR-3 bacterium]